mgnify:CR=1 FL=1
MGVYFFESSALVKRYATETGPPWVCRLTDPVSGNEIYIARLTGVELIAAFVRKARAGEITPSDAQRAVANFKADWATQYQIVEITAAVVNRAMEYAERYGLRGYDAVQLAVAYELNAVRQDMGLPPLVFVCADNDLNRAAVAEGMVVEDPNHHP